jgi:hypothetical protein
VVIKSTIWNTIFTDISTALTQLGQDSLNVSGTLAKFPTNYYAVSAQGVSFATGTLDAATLAITLPTGIINYRVNSLGIVNPSGSLAAGSWGLFTGPGATGATIFPVTSTISIVTATANTNNNMLNVSPANLNTQSYNAGTLYFRVGTAVPGGSADVHLVIAPCY